MEALQWANNKLKKAGIDSPMLDAEILLSTTLDVKKAWLFSHFSDKIRTHQEEQFSLLVDRRVSREPIAYILGRKDFFSRTFTTDPSVLIPRPATESLVEKAIELTKESDPDRTLLVDIGTGSGAIAITLAAETKQHVIAIDIDQGALNIAKQNAQVHNVESSIDFQHGSILEPIIRLFTTLHRTGANHVSNIYPFETLIIAANLPYLTIAQMEDLQPEVTFEPTLALTAGTDGLDAYKELFKQLKAHRRVLPRAIHVLMEIDPEQEHKIKRMIESFFPEISVEILKDLQGNKRIAYMKC
jgi:release factor glutamine methyltransferase